MSARAVLLIQKVGENPRTVEVHGELSLGRSADCGIRLEDQSVSRRHATLRLVPGGKIEVESRGEFSPLRLNGNEVSRGLLEPGAELQVGPFRIQLQRSETPESSLAPHANVRSLEKETVPVGGSTAFELLPESEPVLGMETESGQSPEVSLEESGGGDSFAVDGEANSDSDSGAMKGDSSTRATEQPLELVSDSGSSQAESLGDFASESDAGEDGKTRLGIVGEIKASLSFLPGAANFTDYEFKKEEVSIGRGSNCDIVLNDKKASRKHVVIRKRGLSYLLTDLESANGTFVNGEPVREVELSSGDIIQIGNIEFRFEAQDLNYQNQESSFEAVDSVEQQALMALDSGPSEDLASGNDGLSGNGVFSQPTDGVSGIAGIPGTGPASSPSDGSLIGKFKALPREKRLLYMVVGVLGLAALLFNEEDFSTPAKDPKAKTAQTDTKKAGTAPPDSPRTFEQLSPDEQRFVINQHQLALDHFRNKEYDKSLFEVRRIFTLIPDYQEARAIERYALEGKEKLEALELERRKKEEEAQMKAEIDQLVSDARDAMEKKDYALAEERFGPIISRDPSNVYVENWRKEIEAWKEEQDRIRMERRVDEELNQQARLALKEAIEVQKSGDFHKAIIAFGKVGDFGGSDPRPGIQAKEGIAECQRSIAGLRDPVLKQAKEREVSGELAEAYRLYEKSTQIDPGFPEGYKGMSRIRGNLHDRAKVLYVEGILAESYSDFDTAQKRFSEILTFVPKEDQYFGRAQRKLAPYRTISGASSRQSLEEGESPPVEGGEAPAVTEGGT